MKLAESILVLSLTMVLNTAYANETDGADKDIQSYCNEQAELAGIEDKVELEEYINECIQSYAAPADISQSVEQ